MPTPDRLPDEALDSLLDGSPSEEVAGTPLAAYLDAVRHDAASTRPQPSDQLTVVLSEGLDPVEDGGILTATAGRATTSWRRRSRLAVRALTAKFAALGLLTKAAAAGAAVTVAASGAGVAGVLPAPAQSTFNEVIGREAPAGFGAQDDGTGDEGAETGAATPDTPADTSSTAPLDSDLSDDATGTADGEPGVDGREVASDASDGRSDVSDDAPASGPDERASEERPSEGAPAGTPADDVVPERPGDGRSDTDEAAEQDAGGTDGDTDGSDQPATGIGRAPRAGNPMR